MSDTLKPVDRKQYQNTVSKKFSSYVDFLNSTK